MGYRLQTQDSLKMKLQSMSNKSTDYNVEEISANMIQDRHEVTHLKMYLKWKGKDWFKNTASIAYFSQVGFHCWMSSKVAEFSLYPHNSKHCLASDPICHVSDFILQGLVRPQLFL